MDTHVMCYIIRIALRVTTLLPLIQRVATLVVLLLLIVSTLLPHSH